MSEQQKWDLEITPSAGWFQFHFREIWRYRDLLLLLVRRDFVANYKQTILGPVWMVVQPILTSLTFVIIFSRIANITTDGTPPILFYLSGITWWSYFSESLLKTSGTFIANASIFGKVYFPRMIMPISVVISNLFRLLFQGLVFMVVWLYYLTTENNIQPHFEYLWLLPILILILAGLSLGAGILISSLTTKYRDLTFLLAFGVQLLMFMTPIVYPLSVAEGHAASWILLNPLTPIMEAFKFIFLGKGFFETTYLLYSAGFMVVLVFIGLAIFNKVERSFMDTV